MLWVGMEAIVAPLGEADSDAPEEPGLVFAQAVRGSIMQNMRM